MGATVGLVGSGWRAEFFLRLAALLSDRLTLVGTAVVFKGQSASRQLVYELTFGKK